MLVSFSGAYMPCTWYDTTMSAIQACGGTSIRLLILTLLASDYDGEGVPWQRIFHPMHGLAYLYPWKRVMDSIGPVGDDHALGADFRERVQSF